VQYEYKSAELFNLAFDNVAAIRRRGHSDRRIFAMLGKAYWLGRGRFPEHEDAAFELFSLASESSEAAGMYRLGVCFRHGWGTDVDKARAIDLMHIAAELGDFEALFEMQEYYENVSKEISFVYCCMNSMLGSSSGSFYAGCDLEYGDGCEKDVDKAIVYFKRGARAGHYRCCYHLKQLLSCEEAAIYSILLGRLYDSYEHPTHLLSYISAAEIRAAAEFPPCVIPE